MSLPPESAEFKLHMPNPTDEQLLALQGLAQVFDWQVEKSESSRAEHKELSVDGTTSNIMAQALETPSLLILKDETDVVHERNTPEQDEKRQSILTVLEASKSIARPYGVIFDPKVPSVDNNKKSRLGKIKIGLAQRASWSYTEATEDPLRYDYSLTYLQGSVTNRARHVRMHIKSEDEKPSPSLQLAFDETGEITWIQFESYSIPGDNTTSIAERILQDTAVEKLIDSTCLTPASQRRIEISINMISGTLSYKQGAHRENHAYHPKESMYRLSDLCDGTIKRFTKTPHQNAPKSIMAATEYLQIIQDLLNLIPTSPDR